MNYKLLHINSMQKLTKAKYEININRSNGAKIKLHVINRERQTKSACTLQNLHANNPPNIARIRTKYRTVCSDQIFVFWQKASIREKPAPMSSILVKIARERVREREIDSRGTLVCVAKA